MTQKIQAVAFDVDGLMFNTEMIYDLVGEKMLAQRGHVMRPEVVASMMGRQSQVALQIMIDEYGLSDTVAELAREAEHLFLDLLPKHAAPMPGLIALLNHVDKLNIPKAITTSSRSDMIQPLLNMVSIQDRFDFRLTAEDVTRSKPDPQVYQLAAERFGVAPQNMLVLEDSMVGCRAAAAAAAITVAVPSKHIDEHDFSCASLVVPSLEDQQIYDMLNEGRHE